MAQNNQTAKPGEQNSKGGSDDQQEIQEEQNPDNKEEYQRTASQLIKVQTEDQKIEEYRLLNQKHTGIFVPHGYRDEKGKIIINEYSKSSLFCLSDQNCCRKGFVWLMTWKWFDGFITIAILLNSIMLATTDYQIRLDPDYESEWTPIQEDIDLGFSIVFIVEAFVKIVSMGFIFHKHSYMREAWNVLDFFIVCVSIVGLLPIEGGADSLKALRTFRILRPLRSVNKLPALKQQIGSLLASIPGLMRVFFFIIFIFTIFAIFGTNQFLGLQYQFCRATEEPEFNPDGSFKIWEKLGEDDDGDGPVLCLTDDDCKAEFPDAKIAICGTVYEKAGVDPNDYDGIIDNELIMYGIPGFDNVAQGFLTIFQILTLESWVYLMYNYSDTGSGAISVIFFVLCVLIGAFFTMNLVLAIIVDRFNAASEEAKEKQKQEEQDAKDMAEIQKEKENKEKEEEAAKDEKFKSIVFPDKEKTLGDALTNKEKQVGKGEDVIVNSEKKENADNIDQPLKTEADQVMQTDQDFLDDDGLEYDENEEERQIRLALKERVGKNGCIKCIHDFVTSVSFNFFIFLLIIGNTATLAAYSYDQSDLQENVLELFNEFFTWIFFLEMILKLIGLGWSNYSKDGYNIFDAVIVIISLIDWTLSRIPGLNAGSALNAFRALRLLRMMKLSKSWKALGEILRKTIKSLKDISNFSLLLFLFMYIFALLGMELFSNIALVDGDDNLVVGDDVQELFASGEFYTFPRDNFNHVGWALTTVFIVIIGEDWNWSMYQWVRAYGYESSVSYHIAILFFVLLMIMGNIVLFSLFTAILLNNFEGGDEEEEEEEGEEDMLQSAFEEEEKPKEKITMGEKWDNAQKEFKEAFGKRKRKDPEPEEVQEDVEMVYIKHQADLLNDESIYSNISKQDLEEEEKEKKKNEMMQRNQRQREKRLIYARGVNTLVHYTPDSSQFQKKATIQQAKKAELPPLMGRNTCWCGPDNCFRLFCQKIVESKIFNNTILFLIIVSTVTLALETPLDNPKGEKLKILGYIDMFMTGAFTFEMVVKILAWGFACAGKDSYIRDPWNILDFLIVTSALLGIIAGDSIKVSFFKALRILKVLRPLRVIARNKGLKVAIVALGSSLPNIVNLQVIVLFFVFLLAILQTTLLSGQFNYCHTDHLDLSAKQQGQNIETMWDCINYGGEWALPDLNFDKTTNSILTLITIQTTEGWIDVMWGTVDAVGPYMQPKENNNVAMVVYTMILIIIICMLFMELFVGIVVETFNNQKQLMSGNQSLERSQRAWIEVQLMCMQTKPKVQLDALKYSATRKFCIIMTEHPAFDMTIMIAIMANTALLAFNWYMQPESFELPISIVNYIFVVIFTVEAIVKLIAQRCLYFKEAWNIFDFTVVVMTAIILIINWAGVGEQLEIMGTILRTLRIGRVFRLIKKQEKLQEIFMTLISATPAMGSLGLLLMLLIFMFAIIGMAQFSLIDLDGASEMNKHVNFQSFGVSFLTLLRCSTGEAWNSIMFDSSRTFDILYQCEEVEDYYSIVERGDDPEDTYGPKGCGTNFAIAFHLLFQIIVSQVFLNLFIAIIIDAFFGQTAEIPVKEKTIEDFQRIWSDFDKEASGKIPVKDLPRLILRLSEADEDFGGALIPFKDECRDPNTNFVSRQVMKLEIPTYDHQKNVMFYDVLMKLCHQAIKLAFQKDRIQYVMRSLRVMKMLTASALYDDALEAVHYKNFARKETYDKNLIELFHKFKDPNPRSELVQEMVEGKKKLNRTWNHLVDTNLKIVGEEKFDNMKNLISIDRIELYTTMHLGSAIIIYDFISEFLTRRANRPPEDREDSRASSGRDKGLIPINEVSSRHEHTKVVESRSGKAEFSKLDSASDRQQPSDGAEAFVNIPLGGAAQQSAAPSTTGAHEAAIAANQIDDVLEEVDDESFVPDQHFANQRYM